MTSKRANGDRPSRRSKSRIWKLAWWLLALIVVVAIVAYALAPKQVEITTQRVESGRLSLDLSSTGIVEAHLVDLSPQITARISELYVDEGDTVHRGQLVARLVDSDLKADVSRARAAELTARREADSLFTTADAEERTTRAAIDQAAASLNTAGAKLRELEAGSRIEDIAAQRSMVDQSKARAEDARKRYERAEMLLKDGAISVQERDTAKANMDAADAEVRSQQELLRKLEKGARQETIDAARSEKNVAAAALREAHAGLAGVAARRKEAQAALARLEQAKAELRRSEAQLAYTELRSPMPGIVTKKHKEPGEVATPFDPIFTLAALDSIWVTAEVDEEDAAAVALGQRVKITLDAYPGQTVKGKVVRVSTVAEPKEVGRVRAKIVRAKIIPERTSIPLRPGMEVNVVGSVPAARRTLIVPNDAVSRVGDADTVYVIANGKAKLRKVRIGQSNFDNTQVLSGLREGEVVATDKLGELSDGTQVRVARAKRQR